MGVAIAQGFGITALGVAMLTQSIPLILTLVFQLTSLEIYSTLRLLCTSLGSRKHGSVLEKNLREASGRSQMRFAGGSLQDSAIGTRVLMGLTGLTSQIAITTTLASLHTFGIGSLCHT